MKKIHLGGIEKYFIAFTSLLIFGIILVFLFYFMQISQSLVKKEYEIRGLSLTRRLAADSRLGVMLKNQNMLIAPLNKSLEEEDIVLVSLYDTEGALLKNAASDNENLQDAASTVMDARILNRLQSEPSIVVHPSSKYYDFYMTVRMQASSGDLLIAAEEKVVGYAFLRLSADRIDRSLSKTLTLSLAFGFGILLLGIFVAFVLARKISHPIIAISEKMEEIGTGAADLTKRIHVNRSDELGRLAHGFNNFAKTLSEIIQEISVASPKLAKQSVDLVQTSKGLTSKSENNIRLVQQISQDLSHQAHRIMEVVSKSKNTQTLTKETVESAERSRASSNKILALSEEGRSESKSAIEKIGHLVKMIQQLNDQITVLGSETEQISNISDTINNIAKQTNLLSLNASIEAARAGEAGSGFRIIASEVSKLADMSRFQAEKIGKIISSIVQKIGSMVNDVNATHNGIIHSKDVLFGAAQRMNTISEEMGQVATDIEAIAEKGVINQTSIDRLVLTLDEVSTETKNSASAAQHVSASIQEQRSEYTSLVDSTEVLNHLSEKLKNLVGHFRV